MTTGARQPRSGALVFFGATEDLAYKKIFPALHVMAKRGRLDVPVVGVARSGRGLDDLEERARRSVEEYGGGADGEALSVLCDRLRYIDGDCNDAATFVRFRVDPVAAAARCAGATSGSACASRESKPRVGFV